MTNIAFIPVVLALMAGAAHAQLDAPKIPEPKKCAELAPSLVGRSNDVFLQYEVARNRVELRIAVDEGRAAPQPGAFKPERVNVEVTAGKITRAYCG